METGEDIRIVHLSGLPRARGHAHGEALRPAIAAGISRWKDAIQQSTGHDPDEYLAHFLEATSFMPAIERWTPDLLAEVRGIGEGADVPFQDIYAYQLMDEEWLFRGDMRHGEQPLEHCTMVGAFGEGGSPPVLGQNMDLPKYYDGTQTLLHITYHEGELESLVFTAAGLIGTTGLNSNAIGVCVNTLTQLGHAYQGLPVAFIMRRLLASLSIDEAIDFLRSVDHASGQNYAIGGPDRIVDFECSAHEVAQFVPAATRVYHTNHPLVNPDQPRRAEHPGARASGGTATEARPVASFMSNSEQRFAFIEERLSANAPTLTVEGAKAILSTCEVPISVSRTGEGGSMTLGSLVMELSVPPVLHYAPGPPADTAYTRLALGR